MLGESTNEEAQGSSWNASVIRKECEICKHPIVRDLEVHHIKQRKDAKDQHFSDGTHMNDRRNLVVVCQSCHDKHHAGELEIGPEKQTSKGPQREFTVSPESVKPKKHSKWSNEEQQTIQEYLKKFKHLPLARISYDLQQQEQILISEASLRKLRQTVD